MFWNTYIKKNRTFKIQLFKNFCKVLEQISFPKSGKKKIINEIENKNRKTFSMAKFSFIFKKEYELEKNKNKPKKVDQDKKKHKISTLIFFSKSENIKLVKVMKRK